MKCWWYATYILIALGLTGHAHANIARAQGEIQRELGEIDRLSEALQELCTRLRPEIDAFHSDVAKKHVGADARIKILKPVTNQLSERELSVEQLRSERARAMAHASALEFVGKALPNGPKAFLQSIKHRILLLSQKKIPEQRDLVTKMRKDLGTWLPTDFATRDEYLRAVAALHEKLDRETDNLFQLSFEADWLNEIYRDRVNLRLSDIPSRKALVEGQLGLLRNQLIAEEMSIRSLRQRTSDLERELGEKSTYTSIPPFLPAICARMK